MKSLSIFTLLIVVVSSLQIRSSIPSTSVVNGKLTQTRKITYRCTDADSGITQTFRLNTVNGTKNLTITCQAPQYIYSKVRAGYVPKDGRLSIARYYRVTNQYNNYSVNDSLIYTGQDIDSEEDFHESRLYDNLRREDPGSSRIFMPWRRRKQAAKDIQFDNYDIDVLSQSFADTKKTILKRINDVMESVDTVGHLLVSASLISRYPNCHFTHGHWYDGVTGQPCVIKNKTFKCRVVNGVLVNSNTGWPCDEDDDYSIRGAFSFGGFINKGIKNLINGAGCLHPAAMMALGCGNGGGGGDGGLDPAIFNSFKKAQEDKNRALELFQEKTQQWEKTTTVAIGGLTSNVNDLNIQTANLNEQVGNVNKAIEIGASFNAEMFRALTKNLADVTSQQNARNLALAAALSNSNSAMLLADSATNRAVANLTTLTTQIQSALDSLAQHSFEESRRTNGRIETVLGILRNTIGALTDAASRVRDSRALTSNIQTAIENIRATTSYEPFLLDSGSPRATVHGAMKNMVMDIVRLQYQMSTTTLVEEDIAFYCDAKDILNERAGFYTSADYLAKIGPVGCTPGNPASQNNTDGNCLCWVEIARRECTPSANGAQMFLFNSTLNGTWMCLNGIAGITTVPIARYTNSTLFVAALAGKCSEVTTNSYIMLSSTRRNQRMNISYTSTQCSTDLDIIFDITQQQLSWVFSYFKMIENAYSSLRAVFTQYDDFFDGVIPTGLSSNEIPFTRYTGQPATGMELAFMSFSNEMLPVYRLSYLSFTTSTTTSIDGVTVSYDNIIPSIARAIPDDYKIIGEPASPTAIYDFDQSDLSLGPVASRRKFGPTYPLTEYNRPINMSYFIDTYGESFDAFASTYLAKYGECTITNDICDCPFNPASGTWCSIRANFLVVDTGGDQLVLSPNQYHFDAQVDMEEGSIEAILFSRCPKVDRNDISGLYTQAVFTNVGNDISTVRIVEGGPCPRTWDNYNIDVGRTTVLNIPACLTGTKQKTLSVYYRNETVWTACEGLLNLDFTSNRTQFLDLARVDRPQLNLVSTYASDANALALNRVMMKLANMMETVVYTQKATFTAIGVPPASSTILDLLGGDLSGIVDFLNSSYSIYRGNPDFNYTGVIDTYYGTSIALTSSVRSQNNATTLSLNQLIAGNEDRLNLSRILDQQYNETVDARVNYLSKEGILANATLDIFSHISDRLQAIKDDADDCNSFLCDIVDGLIDGIEWVGRKALEVGGVLYNDVIKPLVETALDSLDTIFGTLGRLLNFGLGAIFWIAIVAVLIFIGVKVYQRYSPASSAKADRHAVQYTNEKLNALASLLIANGLISKKDAKKFTNPISSADGEYYKWKDEDDNQSKSSRRRSRSRSRSGNKKKRGRTNGEVELQIIADDEREMVSGEVDDPLL
jgi:hypothetical protein